MSKRKPAKPTGDRGIFSWGGCENVFEVKVDHNGSWNIQRSFWRQKFSRATESTTATGNRLPIISVKRTNFQTTGQWPNGTGQWPIGSGLQKEKGAAFPQSGADTKASISVAGADCTDTKAAISVAGAATAIARYRSSEGTRWPLEHAERRVKPGRTQRETRVAAYK